MNKLYDNGALMLGKVEDVIKEVEREIKEDLDMIFIDKEDLLKDLVELKELDKDLIVCVDYESKNTHSIDYWLSNDIIKD